MFMWLKFKLNSHVNGFWNGCIEQKAEGKMSSDFSSAIPVMWL